jgi:hypothetical protein
MFNNYSIHLKNTIIINTLPKKRDLRIKGKKSKKYLASLVLNGTIRTSPTTAAEGDDEHSILPS